MSRELPFERSAAQSRSASGLEGAILVEKRGSSPQSKWRLLGKEIDEKAEGVALR